MAKRRNFAPDFKAKVALAAIRDDGPDPVDNGPGGFAINSDDEERMEILSRFLEPTMFPLTVMEVVL